MRGALGVVVDIGADLQVPSDYPHSYAGAYASSGIIRVSLLRPLLAWFSSICTLALVLRLLFDRWRCNL